MRSLRPGLDRRQLILLALVLPATALLFVGGPFDLNLPSYRYLWNMGHVVFFATLTLLFHSLRPITSRRSALQLLAGVTLISLLIEAIQTVIGRSFSLLDLMRNLIGTVAVLWLINRRLIPGPVTLLFALVFAADLTGLAFAGWRDFQIQSRAPILENFEQRPLLSRWKGQLERNETIVREGRRSSKITYKPGKYSTVYMAAPLRDWQGYQALAFSIFNPSDEEWLLTLRIHDEEHELSGVFAYHDRFHQSLLLKPGWNDIEISLQAIIDAPRDRDMDISKVAQLQWFFTDLEQTRTLYLDNIRLQ